MHFNGTGISITDTATSRDFLAGGGNTGSAIRNYNWSETSLGPISEWPTSLKTIVRLVLTSQQPMCLFWGPDLINIYNDAYLPMLGNRASVAMGQPFRTLWADVWEGVFPFVKTALEGKGTWAEDLPLVMTRNGYEEQTYWTFSYSPLHDDNGQVAGLLNIVTETTQTVSDRQSLKQSLEAAEQYIQLQQQHEEQQRLLRNELSHRIKNTLAMTQAIVSQTMRHSDDMDTATKTIQQRIAAMAQAHDMLTRTSWDEVDIQHVVDSALVPHRDHPARFQVTGPQLPVSSEQAMGLVLAVHELATNAMKYGALSHESGTVAIRWSVDTDETFHFEWQETGGPKVEKPTRTGFGSRLTNRIVAAYFSGTGEADYHPDGLHFRLKGKLRTLEQDAA